MNSEEIEKYLSEINDDLAAQKIIGEICIYGGAAMCLAFKARPATKDVDVIFDWLRMCAALFGESAKNTA